MSNVPPLPFTIAFDKDDLEDLSNIWRSILVGNKWSEGRYTAEFESLWGAWNNLDAVSFSSWTGAALGALDFIGVEGETVLCPSNTYLATPNSVIHSGGNVVFYDCNRSDLCGSFDHFVMQAELHKPKAAFIVHIGGHIAFDIKLIADYCRDNNIWLIEDCAHAHGAQWYDQKPGEWGDIGLYSFYATKTISTGEGGMAVSKHPEMIAHLRSFRNYGKGSQHRVSGMNYRIDEFRAALGVTQIRRMPKIVEWKQSYAKEVLDPMFEQRIYFPEGMKSGYYKYIVFKAIEQSTGKVYQQPCHKIFNQPGKYPNTEWVAENHWCVPLYYPDTQ